MNARIKDLEKLFQQGGDQKILITLMFELMAEMAGRIESLEAQMHRATETMGVLARGGKPVHSPSPGPGMGLGGGGGFSIG